MCSLLLEFAVGPVQNIKILVNNYSTIGIQKMIQVKGYQEILETCKDLLFFFGEEGKEDV